MGTWDSAGDERSAEDERGEGETTIDEIAGIIGGSIMAGGTGEVGGAAPGPQNPGTAGGLAVGGMSSRDLVEEESAQPADPDADNAPGTLAGSGAADVGDAPADRDVADSPNTLIAAENTERMKDEG